MSYQNPQDPVRGGRRTGLLVIGIVVLIAGVIAGGALFVTSGSQYDEAVENLQRAPVNCDTEFEFTGTGTFVFYTETKGSIGEIRGDCENTDTEYDHGDDRVRVDLTLADEDGNEIDLDRKSGVSYDAAGYVGDAIRSIELDEPGTYTLAVQSDDDDFAIAVGRNPKEDADSLKTIAIIVGAAGLVLGLLLILLGLRRKAVPAGPSGFSGYGGGAFAPSVSNTPGGFGDGGFGGVAPGSYPQPSSPPLVSPPPPPPPPGGGWGAPNQ